MLSGPIPRLCAFTYPRWSSYHAPRSICAPPTETAYRQGGRNHVMLSEAKHLLSARQLIPPEMLRAHIAGVLAFSLTMGSLGRRRAQHDMVTFSLTMGRGLQVV